MIKNIFEIIKDKYGLYKNKSHNENIVIVDNDKDYIKARILIEENLISDNPKLLTILIKNRQFFNFFIDLEELGDITNVEEIIPLEEFQKRFKYDYSNSLSNEIIVDLNIIDEINNFNEYYDPNYKFEINLLSFKLNLKEAKNYITFEEFFEIIFNKNLNAYELIENSFLFNIFKKFYLDKLNIKSFIKSDILSSIKYNELEKYFDFLLRAYIFSNYKKYIYNNLMDKFKNPLEINLEEYYNLKLYQEENKFFIKQYTNNTNRVNEYSNILKSLKNQISIFSSELDYKVYFKNISGLLDFEFNYIICKILSNTNLDNIKNYDLALISKIEDKFSVLLENSAVNLYLKKTKNMFNILFELQNLDLETNNFIEWSKLYINKYLEWDKNLEDDKHILNIIDILSQEYNLDLSNIKNHVEQQLNELNTKYEKYIFENYNFLMSSETDFGIHNKLKRIKNIINKGNSVIFIVIDAMRWDLWKVIKNIFEKHEYVSNELEDQISLSAIPSATNISRLSLFSGMTYNNLQNKKSNGSYKHGIKNEEKHLKKYFNNEIVRFAKGGKKAFENLVEEKADLYTFIFTDADDMFHGIKDINTNLVNTLFKNQVENIIKQIKKHDYLARSKIIITTDHGSVNITNKTCSNVDKNLRDYIDENNLRFNSHGRYFKIYGEFYNEDLYKKINDYLKKENDSNYYIIGRDLMEKFYLPKSENNFINYFWLINKYKYYTQSTRGEYSHGGMSMSETIIPFAFLEKQNIILELPKINIINYFLVAEQESYIHLSITNNNPYDIHNVEIKFNNLGCVDNIELIRSNEFKEKKVFIIPSISKKIKEDINIVYEITGIKKQITIQEELVIKESNKTKINKSLKGSRDLF